MHVKRANDLAKSRPNPLIEHAQLCIRRGPRALEVHGKLQQACGARCRLGMANIRLDAAERIGRPASSARDRRVRSGLDWVAERRTRAVSFRVCRCVGRCI